jgi:hypothetical protein
LLESQLEGQLADERRRARALHEQLEGAQQALQQQLQHSQQSQQALLQQLQQSQQSLAQSQQSVQRLQSEVAEGRRALVAADGAAAAQASGGAAEKAARALPQQALEARLAAAEQALSRWTPAYLLFVAETVRALTAFYDNVYSQPDDLHAHNPNVLESLLRGILQLSGSKTKEEGQRHHASGSCAAASAAAAGASEPALSARQAAMMAGKRACAFGFSEPAAAAGGAAASAAVQAGKSPEEAARLGAAAAKLHDCELHKRLLEEAEAELEHAHNLSKLAHGEVLTEKEQEHERLLAEKAAEHERMRVEARAELEHAHNLSKLAHGEALTEQEAEHERLLAAAHAAHGEWGGGGGGGGGGAGRGGGGGGSKKQSASPGRPWLAGLEGERPMRGCRSGPGGPRSAAGLLCRAFIAELLRAIMELAEVDCCESWASSWPLEASVWLTAREEAALTAGERRALGLALHPTLSERRAQRTRLPSPAAMPIYTRMGEIYTAMPLLVSARRAGQRGEWGRRLAEAERTVARMGQGGQGARRRARSGKGRGAVGAGGAGPAAKGGQRTAHGGRPLCRLAKAQASLDDFALRMLTSQGLARQAAQDHDRFARFVLQVGLW